MESKIDDTLESKIDDTLESKINDTLESKIDDTLESKFFKTHNNDILLDLSNENIINIYSNKNIISLNNTNNLVQIKKNINDITLKEFLFNNIYKLNKKISSIYCNLDGNEIDILEDLFHHIYINKIKLLLKINFDLKNFNYLLSYFKYDKNKLKIGSYILFEPSNIIDLHLVKKNMSVLIIGYNQYTYIKNMVLQLEKYTNDIVVIDNNSNFEPLLDYYNNEYKYSLLKMDKNYGHKVYEEKFINNIFGNIYILTDPDLEFNKNLPLNFINILINISKKYKAQKVGFALDISSLDIRPELTYGNMPLKMWESQFWTNKINNNNYELYNAAIDTTFCLINKNYNIKSIRVAGNFTCKHLPWHINYHDKLLNNEYNAYLENNVSTNYWNDKFKLNKMVTQKSNQLINIDWIKNDDSIKDDEIIFNNLLILGNNNLESQFIKLFTSSYNYNNIITIKNNINNNKTIKEIFYEIYNKNILINLIYCNYNKNDDYIEDLLYIAHINNIKLIIYNNELTSKYIIKYENIYNYKIINNFIYLKNDIKTNIFKKNMTFVIIGYNQYTYIKNMVDQVKKYTDDIVILDNNSTFNPLLDYYKNEYKYTLLKMDKNYGHKIYESNFIEKIIGNIYFLTDPDLEFNKNLPTNFIEEMINISNYFEAEKVGFALSINPNEIKNDITPFGKSIIEFEKQNWICKLYYPNHELYSAAIVTTFCLINKNNKGGHYRIANNYICKHLPWYKNFKEKLIEGEFEYYKINNKSTNYWK